MEEKRNVILYIATSLDGYIAREDGDLDWLESAHTENDCGYGDLIKRIDTVLMGKTTYEQVLGFDIPYPYSEQKSYIFSHYTTGEDEHATFINEEPIQFVSTLKQQPGKDIWLVGGGKLAASFFKHGLIDEFILAIIPTIIGTGISLYQDKEIETSFALTKVERSGDVALLHYKKK
ncbi:MAG: dihydrofolate reductase family protein, partial [Bacillaceae bacterium]